MKFYNEIGSKAVCVGVNAYMTEDYIEMSENIEIFIIEKDEKRIGFLTINQIDEYKAEIPLIYFDINHIGKGYGKESMEFIEKWVKNNWASTNKLFLDTIIPNYNGVFYKKMGYLEIRNTICEYDGLEIKAKRFEKYLNTLTNH
jgi:GNAT superfamily N-acetyltransferase